MVMLTYQLPNSIREIAMKGEFNEFDLNIFFSADSEGKNAQFKYKNEVQKWLDLIRGSYLETTIDNLKLGAKKATNAVFVCAFIKCAFTYIMVFTECCILLCYEKLIGAKAE